ncbi:lysine 2,3-aminomutase [Anaerobacillus arseniciselenatis]|uniref:Lysine 2,3-aminomutase n=1 Tax=Anaerobacillus arseniciselenatis TaxID=85682 RepID=A0A1S2LKL9_9BACI|nr:lysine 2,3-aminomutase [Anaerobacillus arseniciselenatis]
MILYLKNIVPTFVVDAPGGGGKIALQPNYMISQSPQKVVLRNFEGVITSYPEPKDYVAGQADDYFNEVYGKKEEKSVGVSALLNDEKFNLIPEGLRRLEKRNNYQSDESHSSLKNQRAKRDQMKEKLINAKKRNSSSSETKGDK